MVTVTFLGTAGSTPTSSRALPALTVEYDGKLLLFDCGDGTQLHMIRRNVGLPKLSAVFLSHIHADHTAGMAGLVRSLALNKREAPLDIYIPESGRSGIHALLEYDRARFEYSINVKPIKGGTIYKGRGFEVSAFKVDHGDTPTYGFVFKEDDRWHFMAEKAASTGLKEGPLVGELLKKGSVKVNGRLVLREDVAEMRYGVKVVYVTDTRPTASTVAAARDADLLVHEATYANEEHDLAVKRKHSTAQEAAKSAQKAKVTMLALTHISARYGTRKDLMSLLREATSVFPNTIIAKDGMSIDITKDGMSIKMLKTNKVSDKL
jgi:ribonuclease Z